MAVSKRIFYIDQLRALAIVLVLFAHISTHTCERFADVYILGSFKWASAAFFVDVGVIGVPLFLMITGALLLNREYGNLFDFVKHRYLRILPPFLFWAIITFNIFSFWYVWLMMGIYLFLPIINSFIKDYQMKGVEYFLIIWLICILLNTFGHYPFYKLELSYFFGYIGYVVLGYYLFKKEFNVSKSKMFWLGFILFLGFTFINMFYTFEFSKIYDKHVWLTYLTIVPVFQSIGVFLIFKNLEEYSGSNKVLNFIKKFKFKNVVENLSFCSYGMYLDHMFILGYVLGLPITKQLFSINPLYWLFTAIILIPFLSWLVVYILSKIPYVKYISGAY